MTLVGGNDSIAKTNMYRSLVDQPLLAAANADAAQVAAELLPEHGEHPAGP